MGCALVIFLKKAGSLVYVLFTIISNISCACLSTSARYPASSPLIKSPKYLEVYEKMYASKVGIVSQSSLEAYAYAFRDYDALYGKIFSELRLQDLQSVIDNSNKNYPTLKKIYVLFKLMYEYVMKYDLVGKNCTQYVDLTAKKLAYEGKREEDKHLSHDEVKLLWTKRMIPYVSRS